MGIPQAHSDMAILWPQEFCWRYSLFSDVFPCGKTKNLMRNLLHEHRIWKRKKGTNYLIWLFNDVWLRELDYKWRSPCQDFWQTHEPASPLQGWGVPRHDSLALIFLCWSATLSLPMDLFFVSVFYYNPSTHLMIWEQFILKIILSLLGLQD